MPGEASLTLSWDPPSSPAQHLMSYYLIVFSEVVESNTHLDYIVNNSSVVTIFPLKLSTVYFIGVSLYINYYAAFELDGLSL